MRVDAMNRALKSYRSLRRSLACVMVVGAAMSCASGGRLFSAGPTPTDVAGSWVDVAKSVELDTLVWVLSPRGDDRTLHIAPHADATGAIVQRSEEKSHGIWYVSGKSEDPDGRELCFKRRVRFGASCYKFRVDTLTAAPAVGATGAFSRRQLTIRDYRGSDTVRDRVLLERNP